MSEVANILKHRTLNGWPLFCLVVFPLSLAVLFEMIRMDPSDPRSISALIQLSVRLAVPWLFLAFAASSLAAVFPSAFSRWLLRNRRIIGLCFAAGMAWQLLFICWLVFGHWEYYTTKAYSPYDLAEQLPGYVVLAAMTVTSFKPGRAKLTAAQWHLLHKAGIYFLWAVVWSTYWFELFYYHTAQFIDYVFYWAGFAAWEYVPWPGAKNSDSKAARAVCPADPFQPTADALLYGDVFDCGDGTGSNRQARTA